MTNTKNHPNLTDKGPTGTRYICEKGVVSRRNQDGKVILMRTDESSMFYTISGLAASVWAEFAQPVFISELVAKYISICPKNVQEIQNDIFTFVGDLYKYKLITETTEMGASVPSVAQEAVAPCEKYQFGGIQEYNLEQIESEILNESLYLDVFSGSDLRLKTDVAQIENALDKISRLDGITYKWKSDLVALQDSDDLGVQAGVIAQQVAVVMPELVKKDSKTENLAVNYAKFTPYLIEAIKELKSILSLQEARLKAMEERFGQSW